MTPERPSWLEDIISYCLEFNIPIENLSEILRDPKVNPMIRGKGFEFNTYALFRNLLNTDIWTVSKPNMNAQAMQHDVDILIHHNETSITISVECKLAKKKSFSISAQETISASVKCMRSRTLGVEIINERAPIMGVSVAELTAHKDNYLTTDFDLVVSSLGNALYSTDPTNGNYVWAPATNHLPFISNILQTTGEGLKTAAFEYILLARASKLSPAAGYVSCSRRTCNTAATCVFIPNYPVVNFDNSTFKPLDPWNSISELESLLNQILSEKISSATGT